jgi:hypothetical protein
VEKFKGGGALGGHRHGHARAPGCAIGGLKVEMETARSSVFQSGVSGQRQWGDVAAAGDGHIDQKLEDFAVAQPLLSDVARGRKALAARGLTASDIEMTLRKENVELPAGRVESLDHVERHSTH